MNTYKRPLKETIIGWVMIVSFIAVIWHTAYLIHTTAEELSKTPAAPESEHKAERNPMLDYFLYRQLFGK